MSERPPGQGEGFHLPWIESLHGVQWVLVLCVYCCPIQRTSCLNVQCSVVLMYGPVSVFTSLTFVLFWCSLGCVFVNVFYS